MRYNMPEIAEVETVRNVLKSQILNKQITKIDVYYPKMIENNIEEFQKSLINSKFVDIKRRGKYLLFETSKYYLISHLRMEGKYFFSTAAEPKSKHEHIRFTFDDDTSLRYEDVRKFGRMHLVSKNKLETDVGVSKQGVEANSKDLTGEYIYTKIKAKSLPMKTILLDQTIISGLGNIYADEVLYYAKISPLKKGKDINIDECQRIAEGSIKIINNAIKYGGTTIRSYTSSLGVTGHYQDYLKVHTKANQKCQICGNMIKKIKIGGRSTYYCEKCQK